MHAIIEAATLQDWTDTIGEVVDEYKLFVDGSGFHTAAVDPAQIAMIDTTLTRSAFESFDPEAGPDVGVIGIPHQKKFSDMIGKASDGDLIELRLNDSHKLEIGIGGATITMSPLDPATITEEPDISELGLPNTVEFSAAEFGDAVGLTDLVSDHAHIEGRPDGDDGPIAFTAKGDTDGVETVLDREQITDGSVDEETDVMFSLEYLKRTVKAMNGADEAELRFGDEMPIILEFSPCDYANATMLLAPRLET